LKFWPTDFVVVIIGGSIVVVGADGDMCVDHDVGCCGDGD
jgi:hypothetical protein